MIKPWEKIGNPVKVAGGAKTFGKRIEKRKFFNPNSGETLNFFMLEGKPWVVVIPLTRKNQVIMIKQYNPADNKFTVEIPGGVLDSEKETPLNATKRELLEETGYSSKKFIFLGKGSLLARHSTTPYYCFLAKDCKKIAEPQQGENEKIEIKKVSLKNFAEMISKKDFTQHESCLLFLRALPYLNLKIKNL